MASGITILKAFNIKQEEKKPVFLMVSYSFFMGVVISFFYTAAISLFMHNFQRDMLPYVYIAGGLVIYLFGFLYNRILKRLRISQVLVSGIIFLLITSGLIALGYSLTLNKWLAFLMFIWINIFMFIHGVGFNGMASKIFSLQQGKRLFGIIGVGEVVSNVLSFFSVPFILKYMKTESLPLISLVGLVITMGVILLIISSFRKELSGSAPPRRSKQAGDKKMTSFFQDRFTLFLFILALLPVFGLYFVDYVFLGQTKMIFPDKEVMSSFIGIFFGVMALVEFIIKTFFYGRMISKFGLKLGLVALPLTLLFSTFIASVVGTAFGIASMFSLIVLSKLFIRSVRNAVNDPSFLILFQVLPAQERFIFQGKIEGGPKAISNIVVGAVLILLVQLGFSLVQFNYVFLIILIFWAWASFRMYFYYKQRVKKVLENQSYINADSGVLKAGLEFYEDTLVSSGPEHLPGTYFLLSRTAPYEAGQVLSFAYTQADEGHKINLLRLFRDREAIEAYGLLQQQRQRKSGEALRNVLEDTYESIRALVDVPFEELVRLSESGSDDDRRLGANLVGISGRYQSLALLVRLLNDRQPEVRKAALIAAGKTKRHEVWPYLLEMLRSEEYGVQAEQAITAIGNPMLKDLESLFQKSDDNLILQQRIIRIFGEIGSPEAVRKLRNLISHPGYPVRIEALQALVKNQYVANTSESQVIRQMIEDEVAYIVWVLNAMRDTAGEGALERLHRALGREVEEKKQLLFSFMGLMYEATTMKQIRDQLHAGTSQARMYAIEIFDMTVSSEMKDLVLPLLENLPLEETLHAYRNMFPQEKLAYEERLIDIADKDYSRVTAWTKACALEALGKYPSPQAFNTLLANINHNHQLIREASVRTLAALEPARIRELAAKFCRRGAEKLEKTLEDVASENTGGCLLLAGKADILKKTALFRDTDENLLVPVPDPGPMQEISAEEEWTSLKTDPDGLYLIVSGTLEARSGRKVLTTLGKGEFIGKVLENVNYFKSVNYIAKTPVRILRLHAGQFYRLLGSDLALMQEFYRTCMHIPAEAEEAAG